MRSYPLIPFALALFLSPQAISQGDGEPGAAACFGVDCPCENDDAGAGCINSTGVGGLLTGTGTSSVSADDLILHGTQLPPNSVSIVVCGDQAVQVPFMNGLRCVGGTICRLQQHKNTGQDGVVWFDCIVERYSWQNVHIQPGDHLVFQIWHRDSPPHRTPCGAPSNLTNAYEVIFTR